MHLNGLKSRDPQYERLFQTQPDNVLTKWSQIYFIRSESDLNRVFSLTNHDCFFVCLVILNYLVEFLNLLY